MTFKTILVNAFGLICSLSVIGCVHAAPGGKEKPAEGINGIDVTNTASGRIAALARDTPITTESLIDPKFSGGLLIHGATLTTGGSANSCEAWMALSVDRGGVQEVTYLLSAMKGSSTSFAPALPLFVPSWDDSLGDEVKYQVFVRRLNGSSECDARATFIHGSAGG